MSAPRFAPHLLASLAAGAALGSRAVAVAMALGLFTDREGRCWPSVSALAQASGRSERFIRYGLRDLEASGLLVTRARRVPGFCNKSNVYEFVLHRLIDVVEAAKAVAGRSRAAARAAREAVLIRLRAAYERKRLVSYAARHAGETFNRFNSSVSSARKLACATEEFAENGFWVDDGGLVHRHQPLMEHFQAG